MTIHDSGLRIEGFDELTPIGRGGSSDVYRGRGRRARPHRGRQGPALRRAKSAGSDPARSCVSARRPSACRTTPNIATVFRSGVTADGRPYVVVEDADQRLARRRAPRRAALARACRRGRTGHRRRAGVRADAHGVQHRDVKPSNVLVVADCGTPLLADFGLAVVAGLDRDHGQRPSRPPLAYVPPSARSSAARPTDERSDVYSLGRHAVRADRGSTTVRRAGAHDAGGPGPDVELERATDHACRCVACRYVNLAMSMLSADPSARPDLEAVIVAPRGSPRRPTIVDRSPSPTAARTRRGWHRARRGRGLRRRVVVGSRRRHRETSPAARLAATPCAARGSTPYRAGTDESAELAASLSGTDAATAAIVDRPATAAADRGVPAGTDLPGDPVPPRLDAMAVLTSERCRAVVLGVLPVGDDHDGFAATARPRGQRVRHRRPLRPGERVTRRPSSSGAVRSASASPPPRATSMATTCTSTSAPRRCRLGPRGPTRSARGPSPPTSGAPGSRRPWCTSSGWVARCGRPGSEPAPHEPHEHRAPPPARRHRDRRRGLTRFRPGGRRRSSARRRGRCR